MMQQLESITVADLTRAALILAWTGKRAGIAATGVDRALYLAARNHRQDADGTIQLSKAIVDRATALLQ
jgi:hypothetical protein